MSIETTENMSKYSIKIFLGIVLSKCLTLEQCISNCLMVSHCTYNCPIITVSWLDSVCLTVQWLDRVCPIVWWLDSVCPIVRWLDSVCFFGPFLVKMLVILVIDYLDFSYLIDGYYIAAVLYYKLYCKSIYTTSIYRDLNLDNNHAVFGVNFVH